MTEDVSKKVEGFFAGYRLRKYAKGQVLLLGGEEADYVYHLVSGRVKQYDVNYRGDEIVLNVYKPSAFFPMSLAINKGQTPYIYEAETDIEVHQVPADDAVGFIKDNPDVLFDLLSRVYRGLDGVLGRIVHLVTSSAKKRLIYELVTEAQRFGIKQDDNSVLIEIHEKELGARGGLSRETVSREMHKLKNEGFIEAKSRNIRIKDLLAFEKILSRDL